MSLCLLPIPNLSCTVPFPLHFSTQKSMASLIPFKPDANLIFYFPTTRSSTIYTIIPCPYLSTPIPPFIFNLQKSSPEIFAFFGTSTAFFNSIIYCHLLSINILNVYLLARSISFLKNHFLWEYNYDSPELIWPN